MFLYFLNPSYDHVLECYSYVSCISFWMFNLLLLAATGLFQIFGILLGQKERALSGLPQTLTKLHVSLTFLTCAGGILIIPKERSWKEREEHKKCFRLVEKVGFKYTDLFRKNNSMKLSHHAVVRQCVFLTLPVSRFCVNSQSSAHVLSLTHPPTQWHHPLLWRTHHNKNVTLLILCEGQTGRTRQTEETPVV